jgi:hypothetical protein
VVRCLCGQPAAHHHHVVYAQHVRKHGGDVTDPRNFLPLCVRCHALHHGRVNVIQRSQLSAVHELFAAELMGDYASDYLDRYYDAVSDAL